MGIRDLSTIIKESKVPITTISFSDIDGIVAIDANAIFFANWSESARVVTELDDRLLENGPNMEEILKRWIISCANFVENLRDFGINVILCFDGKAPVLKQQTQESRSSTNLNYIDLASQEVKKACEIVGKEYVNGMLSIGEVEDPFILRELSDIRKRHGQCIKNGLRPSWSDWEKLRTAFTNKGFDVRICNIEGETLACKLIHDKEAKYVYSRDSDCLAYNIPFWFKKVDLRNRTFQGYATNDVLTTLLLDNHSSLMDICILLGCDYNKNLKKIGKCGVIKRMTKFKWIKDGFVEEDNKVPYKSIEEMMENEEHDYTVLNYEEVRKIFRLEIDVIYSKESISVIEQSDIEC